MTDKFRYRPEIDGLRAVAVLAVVLFHGGFGCPGGYIGVDVFFVISGFLITSLIWKDLESGRFSFANFWERRARRIIPALVVVTLAVLVAGWFLLLPSDFKSLGRASASQAVFAANFHYWLDSGYFSGDSNEKPLLHTWSLAVEEQFYLFVPFLLWGMFRIARLRRRTAAISLLSLGFLLSFALSIYQVALNPTTAFYLLPSRAWELLLGALVAFLPPQPALPGRRISREFFALAGLALILVPVFIYRPNTPFPGLAALCPCLGAALLIRADERAEGSPLTFTGALLANRLLVFIGLISYSLYLWHWPLLAFARYWSPEPLSSRTCATLLGFSFLLAVLSWKYVETPFRKRKLAASRKSMFAFAGAGLAVVLGGGVFCMARQGFPDRIRRESREFANAKADSAYINNMPIEDIRAGKLIPIGVENPSVRPTVLVWGDSHAMAAMPAVDAFLKQKGLAGIAATHYSTPPILGWYKNRPGGLDKDAPAYNEAVFSYIQSHHIPNVMLISIWCAYLTDANDGDALAGFDPAFLATVRRLVAIGCRPWIMLDVPTHSFNIPKMLASARPYSYIDSLCAKPTQWNELQWLDHDFIGKIEAAGGHVLDPKPLFLDPTGKFYIVQSHGISLYRDGGHLTAKGAMLMLLPFFENSLKFEKP